MSISRLTHSPLIHFLFCLLLWTPSIQAAQDIDIQGFARHSEFDEVKISPDGQYLAAGVNDKNGQRSIVIIRLKDKKVTARSSFSDKVRPGEFTWVNKERLVIELNRNYGLFDQPLYTGDLYAVNVDGSHRATIFGPNANAAKSPDYNYSVAWILDVMRDDPRRILIQANRYDRARHLSGLSRVYTLDVYNGRLKKKAVSPYGDADLMVDHNHQVRAALGVKRDDLFQRTVYYRDSPEDKWKILKQFDIGNALLSPVAFTLDNRKLLVESTGDGDTVGLFLLDPEQEKMEALSQNSEADLSQVLQDHEGDIIGVSYEPDRPEYDIFGKNRAAKQMRGFLKAFKGQRVTPTSRSWDGRFTVLRVSSDTNAGDYYLYDGTTRKLNYLLSSRPWEKPDQLRPMKPIEVIASDGIKLPGYITLPEGEGPFPMVVMPHGGPHGPRDYWVYDPDTQLLANAGYAVLQINFRGSGGYGSQFESSGYGEWGRRMQKDITDATRWAIEKGYADADRICIYGGSYGGYASLMGAATEPDLYRCAIGYAGVYDLNMMYEKGDIQWTRRGKSYLDRVLGTDPEERAARSPVHLADRIKVPVLLIHGGKDLRVPIAHAKALEKALKASGNTPETLYRKKEGHGFFKEEHRIEVYRRILDFLQRNIGGQKTG